MYDLPETLPWDTRATYARLLLEQRPLHRDQLAARVATYLSHIATASERDQPLDTEAARALGNALLELIKLCPEEQTEHLQAMVAYFIHSDDAEHDLDSTVGFDDDINVFNAVCEHVGLPHLKLPA